MADKDVKASQRYARRNVYGLSTAFVVNFSAFWGLQNLQSSISGDLGLISLSVAYICFILCGFVAPGFIKVFGTKYSLAIGFVCHLIYTLCNYYPECFTLIPGSIVIGAAAAPIWASVSSHLAEVAKTVAPILGKDQDYLISKYTGIFFFFFSFANVPGNLASSLIFFPYRTPVEQNASFSFSGDSFNVSESENETIFPSSICGNLESATIERVYQRYSFVSIGVLFNISGLLILMLFVDRLPTENSFFSTERKFRLYIQKPFIRLLRVLKHKHMLLIAPMAVTSGMEMAFAFGTFTKVYISDSFAIYLVGFAIILFGMSSSAMSMAYSKLVKCIPRFAIALFGASLNIGLIIFLLIWERVPSYAFIFSFAVIWGVADAIWNTVPTSLTGILFVDCPEVGYSAMRIWQSFGYCVGFAAPLFKPANHRFEAAVPLSILLLAVVLASLCVLVIEFTTQRRQPCCRCFRVKDINISATEGRNKELEENPQNWKDSLYNAAITYQGKIPSTWSTDSTDYHRSSVCKSVLKQGTTLAQVSEDNGELFKDGVHPIGDIENEISFVSLLRRSDSYEDAITQTKHDPTSRCNLEHTTSYMDAINDSIND